MKSYVELFQDEPRIGKIKNEFMGFDWVILGKLIALR